MVQKSSIIQEYHGESLPVLLSLSHVFLPQIDDQISLLINAWCELLVLSSCHRSVSCTPGVIRVSSQVTLTLEDAVRHGIEKCLEKMICFTEQLRRLKVDQFEYVSMKLICLLTSGRIDHPLAGEERGGRGIAV